jgi:2-polyprenyl-3-methyl-5-hydroxy-6-metoxy-1,4-benzoquinol methylase
MSTECKCCGSSKLLDVLDLGLQPPANLLRESPSEHITPMTLKVLGCESCGHMQQVENYNEGLLFSHYLYQSGTSNTLRLYFKWLATEVAAILKTSCEQRVLEVACNDGSFMDELIRLGVDVEGIDPAENLVTPLKLRCNNVTNGYFPEDHKSSNYAVIVAMNVLAHTSEPLKILSGIAERLSGQGVAIIQTSQADMLENGEFDTVYHEHYSFFSPESMRQACERSGLRVANVFKTKIHGNSFLFFLTLKSNTRNYKLVDEKYSLGEIHALPNRNFVSEFNFFRTKVDQTRQNAKKLIDRVSKEGNHICLVGVAAKAITLCQFLALSPDTFVDEAVLKIGKYPPGHDVPILTLSAVSDMPKNTTFLIGAWNFREELMEKINKLRIGKATSILTIFPEISLISFN